MRVYISGKLLTNAEAVQVEQRNSREFMGEAKEESIHPWEKALLPHRVISALGSFGEEEEIMKSMNGKGSFTII